MTPTPRLFQSQATKRYLRRHFWKRMAATFVATVIALATMIWLAGSPAHARGFRHHHSHHHVIMDQRASGSVIVCDLHGCRQGTAKIRIILTRKHGASRTRAERVASYDANGNSTTIIGSRPDGCPHAYCGCGLRKYLGLSDPRLNLADNWKRLFPRTYAHTGAVGVRLSHWNGHGHVVYLESHAGGNDWLVRDYNSGGGLSRLHVRDLSGYVFVNPSGRLAALSGL